jgi:hypothetical protein
LLPESANWHRIGTEARASLLVQEVCDKSLRLIGGILLHIGKRVGVSLQREGDGRMSGALGYNFRMDAAPQKFGNVRMAQTVDRHGSYVRL